MPSRLWSINSTRTSARSFAASRLGFSKWSMPIRQSPLPIGPPDAIAFYLQPLPEGVWKNEVTVRSGRLARMYEPGSWAARVAPTPLLIIVALADNITLTDVQLRAYEQMLEPKKLVTVEGGHFDPYLKQFPRASEAAVSWFRHHLGVDAHQER